MGATVDPTAAVRYPVSDRLLAPFDRDVLLVTGRAIRVRAAARSDVAGLQVFYEQLSDTSTYYRFFGLRRFIPPEELDAATAQDPQRHVTLLAEAEGVVIGIGEYHAPLSAEEAEVAFAVADAHQHEGVGTVLLEDLAMIARAAGFRRLVASTMPGNTPMRRVFRTVGLVTREWFDDGAVHIQLDLTADQLMQDDADLRDWRAAVASLRSVLHPSGGVVIGASHDGRGPGCRIVGHLLASFQGQVSVMHPTGGVVAGIHSVTSIGALQPIPDLAVIAVPAAAVVGVVDECGRCGVLAAVVISDGFAERDDDGRRRQDELLAVARSHGMRIVGPNCLGVVSTRCGLNATFTDQRFAAGGIAVAAQSGGVGIAIAAEAERRNAGISAFVSMGNKADVSGNDLLRAWADDDHTSVIALYLESIGDPIRFGRIARAVSLRKPIVALKGGRSEPGRRGARSHTAAIATDQLVVDALFAHTGVLRARTLEELVDAAILFDRQPAMTASRVAFIGNAGGPLILGADAAADLDLVVPELSAELRGTVAGLVARAASTANPVDLGSGVTGDELAAVTRAIATSGQVDACIVVVVDIEHNVASPAAALVDVGVDVPIAIAHTARGDLDARLAVYPTAERATAAVAIAAQRARWLTTTAMDSAEHGSATSDADADAFALARRIVRRSDPTTSWLDPPTTYEMLETAGVPVTPWRYARSAAACTRAATQVGLPCVVKGDVDQLLHKSDEDAVILGVPDAEEANDAYWDLAARFGDRLRGVVVQAQAEPGLELLVGFVRHPGFGPVVVVGAGGTEAELGHDRAVLMAPVSVAEATRAIEGLQLAPLLHGYRGRPVLPVDRIADLVHRVSVLAIAVPELEQLDLNPVIAGPAGCVTVDARAAITSDDIVIEPLRALRGRTHRSDASPPPLG